MKKNLFIKSLVTTSVFFIAFFTAYFTGLVGGNINLGIGKWFILFGFYYIFALISNLVIKWLRV